MLFKIQIVALERVGGLMSELGDWAEASANKGLWIEYGTVGRV